LLSFALDTADIGVVVDELNLPRRWQPFELPEVGRTQQERRDHVDAAWHRVRNAGLLDGNRLDAEVEGVFSAWVDPDLLVIVRAHQTEGQQQLLYRVTATRGTGVFSQLVGDQVHFEEIHKQAAIPEITSELPPVPALSGLGELTVTRGNASDEVAEEDFNPLASSAPSGTAAAEQREMRKFAQWPLQRLCSFELSVRNGNKLNPLGTAQVIDTDGGRYVILPDGTQRLRIIPSDGSHLTRWLADQAELGMDS